MDDYLIYNGKGWLPGIPARNLTRAEFDALDKDQRASVMACGSYDVVSQSKKKNAPVVESAEE